MRNEIGYSRPIPGLVSLINNGDKTKSAALPNVSNEVKEANQSADFIKVKVVTKSNLHFICNGSKAIEMSNMQNACQ